MIRRISITLIVTALAATMPAWPAASAAAPKLHTIPGTAYVQALSCPTASLCWAGGYESGSNATGFLVKITNGIPGRLTAVPGTSQLDGLSCPTKTFCEAAANGNSGATNHREGVVAIRKGKPGKFARVGGVSIMFGVSCASAKACVAVASGPDKKNDTNDDLVVPITKGKPGKAHAVPGAAGIGASLFAVSCVKSDVCEAVGSGLYGSEIQDRTVVVRISNGTPSAPAFDPEIQLDGISCFSAGNCMAVGVDQTGPADAGIVVPITNGSPGSERKVAGSSWLYGIACRNATTCTGSGNISTDTSGDSDGVLFTISGSKISGAATVGGVSNLDVVSCPASGACASGGSTSNTLGAQEGAVLTTAGKTHKAKPKLKLAASPKGHAAKRAKITFTLTVSRGSGHSRPSGSAGFTSGSKTLCKSVRLRPAKASARASCRVRGKTLGVGKHTIKVTYAGNAHYRSLTTTTKYRVS